MSAEIFIFPNREPIEQSEPAPEPVECESFIRWERMGPGWWFCLFVTGFYLWSFA